MRRQAALGCEMSGHPQPPPFYNAGMPKPPAFSESDVLQRVTLRLVGDEERDVFDGTLKDQHYLASARLAGQRFVEEFMLSEG